MRRSVLVLQFLIALGIIQVVFILSGRRFAVARAIPLIAITTCNQFNITRQLVNALEKLHDSFDVIFVDDFSTDGTVQYLKSRGFVVLTSMHPEGLTHSWNRAYAYWKLRKQYLNLFIANNDVLIPDAAIERLDHA